ncbi:Altronate dehydratase [Paenibacillus sp. P1XP2]|nr:Altronate dehydratase [Paenibacillus sp. P1XP2]
MKQWLKLNPRDTVAVALRPIAAGEAITGLDRPLTALSDIPQGHKIALARFEPGDMITKYGYPIGHAANAIEPGEWVHTHNMKTNLSGEEKYEYVPDLHPISYPPRGLTFQGYRRKNGASASATTCSSCRPSAA